MQLHPGKAAEYKKRHDEIWPELKQALLYAGITEYYIFLDEQTNILFAFQKIKDPDQTPVLPHLPEVKKWWAYMADIMATNPDKSPVVTPVQEVFRLTA